MVCAVPGLDAIDGLDGGKAETCLLESPDAKVVLGASWGTL